MCDRNSFTLPPTYRVRDFTVHVSSYSKFIGTCIASVAVCACPRKQLWPTVHRSTFVKRLTPMRWDLWRDEAQRTCDMIGTQSIRVVKKYEVEVEQGGGCSRRRRLEEEVRYTLPSCTPTPWMMSGGSIFSRILIFKDHRHTNKEQVSLLEG